MMDMCCGDEWLVYDVLGVREIRNSVRRYGPLGVPADLQSAAVGFSYLQIRDAAFSLEADCKSASNRSSLFVCGLQIRRTA